MFARTRTSIGISAALATFALASVVAQNASPTPAQSQEVVVNATNITDDTLIGENQQPEWTAHRLFPTTRVYVLPPWQVEFEQWWQSKYPREGESEHIFQSEVELGLPYRFQVDFYENVDHVGGGSTNTGNQIEGRWAFANWDKIPLNPTLYGEWKFNGSGPDAYELKLLFGEQLAPHWHWGFNVFYEQEVGGPRATELGFSQAFGYSIDTKLSVGVEMNFERTTEQGSRRDPTLEFLVGPSIQWRPTRRTHLDLVPLIGTTGDSPHVEAFVVFGIELGSGSEGKEIQAPVSVRAR